MTKRFKLLKPLPGYKAGTIFEVFDPDVDEPSYYPVGKSESHAYISKLFMWSEMEGEWFEPIEPEQPRWEVEDLWIVVPPWKWRTSITLNCSEATAEKIREAVEAVLELVFDSEYKSDLIERVAAARIALQKERGGDE